MKISDQAADLLWRKARSYNDYTPQPVGDDELRAVYELTKWGPSTANSQPLRIVFLRSPDAKARLAPALSSANMKKVAAAPVVAVLAYDMRFFEHLTRMYGNPAARSWYETTPEAIQTTALRNSSMQAGYFILAARALGLDCGPMSGFNNDKIDAEFFPEGQFKSNLLCCLGHGDATELPPRGERFAFDEVCRIL